MVVLIHVVDVIAHGVIDVDRRQTCHVRNFSRGTGDQVDDFLGCCSQDVAMLVLDDPRVA